jgi:hypothetical protein
MNCIYNKTRSGSCILYLALCICLILLFACDRGSETYEETSSSSGTGSIAFTLTVQGITGVNDMSPLAIDCIATGISTIEASVYNQSDVLLKTGGPWNCNVHQGTITDVKAGTNYTVVVLGRDSVGDILYEGQSSGVAVTAGQTNNIGEITLEAATLIWDRNDRKWDKTVWE